MFINRALKHFLFVFLLSILSFSSYVSGEGRCSVSFSTLTGHIRVASGVAAGFGRDVVTNLRTRTEEARNQMTTEAEATEVAAKDEAQEGTTEAETVEAGTSSRGQRLSNQTRIAANVALGLGRDAVTSTRARAAASRNQITAERAEAEGSEASSPNIRERLSNQGRVVSNMAQGLGRDAVANTRTRAQNIRQQRAEETQEAETQTEAAEVAATEQAQSPSSGVMARGVRAVSHTARSAVATGRDGFTSARTRVRDIREQRAEERRLGIPARVWNILNNEANIYTREDLVGKTEEDLLSIKGIGNKIVDHIKKELAERGSSLSLESSAQTQSSRVRGQVRAVSNAARSAVATGRDAVGNIQTRVQESSHRIAEESAAQVVEGEEAVAPTRTQRLGTQAHIVSDVALGLGRDGFTSARTRVRDIREQRAEERRLGIPARVWNILNNEANIYTREDLVGKTEEDLLSIKGIGNKIVDHIKKELAERGSSLSLESSAQTQSSRVRGQVRAVSNAARSAVATGRDAVGNIQTRVQESSHRIAEESAAQVVEGEEAVAPTRTQRLGTQAHIVSDVALGLGRDGFTSARTRVRDIREQRAARRAAATEENETSTTVKPEEATAEAGRVVADQEESS